MTALSMEARRALAARVRLNRDGTADSVTTEFLAGHPDFLQRYGDRARERGVEDARCHCDFLAAAIEGGSAQAFADYAAWVSRVLAARGIAPSLLVENLEQVASALGRSLTPEEMTLVAECIDAGREACRSASGSRTGAEESRSPFLQAILTGQRQAAMNIVVELLAAGSTVVDAYADLLQGAMYEVGRLWEQGTITVAHEHMATSTVQFVIAQLYPRLPRPAGRRGRAIIAGVQGELHQIGAMMVADALEADGWNVRFFGTNVPHSAILAAVDEEETHVLGVSATMLLSLPQVVELFSHVRGRPGPRRPALVLGGALARRCPEVVRDLDVIPAPPDLRDSVSLFRGIASVSG